jgi:hypothetical protein
MGLELLLDAMVAIFVMSRNIFWNFGNVVEFEGRGVCKSWGWI